MKKIFCGCQRCFKYYSLNDRAEIPFANGVTKQFEHINFEQAVKKDEEEVDVDSVRDTIINRKGIVFGQFLNFLNYFAEIGGFDALIDALKAGNEAQEDRMPLDVISLLVNPFRTCNTVFAETFASSLVEQVKVIVLNRLGNMTEKELKEIDKESVSRILTDLKDFFTLSMTDIETAELIEKNKLNIAMRFLKSTYLEKRLKGISDIKVIIEQIEALNSRKVIDARYAKSSAVPDYDGGVMGMGVVRSSKGPKFINAETLKDWILD